MNTNTKKTPSHKKRLKYLDIAKGIAISLVVLGHTASPFKNFLYLFHVPLFFFISGYFYSDTYAKHVFDFIKRRIKSLYIPFLAYEFIFLMLHNVAYVLSVRFFGFTYFSNILGLYTFGNFIQNSILIIKFFGTEKLLGPLWFLPCLFLLNIMFVIICYISEKISSKYSEYIKFILTTLCFLAGIYVYQNSIHLKMFLGVSLIAVILYYFGYFYKKHQSLIDLNAYLFILSFLFLLANSFYGRFDMFSSTYPSVLFFISNSLAGIYFIIFISRLIENKSSKLLTNIGQNTIPILALHISAFQLVTLTRIHLNHGQAFSYTITPDGTLDKSWWLIYFIVGILLPLGLITLWNKMKNKFSAASSPKD